MFTCVRVTFLQERSGSSLSLDKVDLSITADNGPSSFSSSASRLKASTFPSSSSPLLFAFIRSHKVRGQINPATSVNYKWPHSVCHLKTSFSLEWWTEGLLNLFWRHYKFATLYLISVRLAASETNKVKVLRWIVFTQPVSTRCEDEGLPS